MALKKKKKEIRRLIALFEQEASNFHDVQFYRYFSDENNVFLSKGYETLKGLKNYRINLWQYYGCQTDSATERFLKNLPLADQWGIKGAKLTAWGAIGGEAQQLFIRMAKRAGDLFSQKESYKIENKIRDRIVEEEVKKSTKPMCVFNGDKLAVWLNYLLFYVSKTSEQDDGKIRIEPDPFTLSLFALEDLLENQEISAIDKSPTKIETIDFEVSFSFSGDQRNFVSTIANFVRNKRGADKLFYDLDYQSQLARPNLDILLQKIYSENSKLIVVFLSKDYENKEWCGLEWRAIREIIKTKEDNKVMFIRFDDSQIIGVFSIDGYIDARQYSEYEIAQFILERIQLNEN